MQTFGAEGANKQPSLSSPQTFAVGVLGLTLRQLSKSAQLLGELISSWCVRRYILQSTCGVTQLKTFCLGHVPPAGSSSEWPPGGRWDASEDARRGIFLHGLSHQMFLDSTASTTQSNIWSCLCLYQRLWTSAHHWEQNSPVAKRQQTSLPDTSGRAWGGGGATCFPPVQTGRRTFHGNDVTVGKRCPHRRESKHGLVEILHRMNSHSIHGAILDKPNLLA